MAVLAVMAVHAWPEVLRGGFVGVDIFFVLSGFLITSLMLDSMTQGRFTLADFYRRRVLRLFPALCTVLLFCLVGAVFTFPSETRQIGKHIAASAVFASNLALWQEAGYFDASSESKPLLHLWSLGIEEQFYLVWPLAVIAMFRWRRYAFWIVAGLMLASFALNVLTVVPKPKGTFFLLPTRAWELLAGAALAMLQRYGLGLPALSAWGRGLAASRIGPRLPDLMSWVGLLLIAAAFALLEKTSAFPGWWALLPTCGTVLLLAANEHSWVNRHLLSHPVMVFYGGISYPLYLWHWPLLVFPVLLGWEMDFASRVAAVVLSVGLAVLTKEFIERPIRFGRWRSRAPAVLAGAMACIGASGLVLVMSDGLLATYPRFAREVARADFAMDYSAYRSQRCFLDLELGPSAFTGECWSAAKVRTRPLTLLWGDSHAASLYPGLAATISEDGNNTFLAQFTKAECPPMAEVPARASRQCLEVNDHVMRQITASVPDTVILAGYWSRYANNPESEASMLRGLRHTVAQLKELGVRHVVVMGHLPTWPLPLPRLLLTQWRQNGQIPERTTEALDPPSLRLDREVRLAIADLPAVFISPIERLCRYDGCLTSRTSDGVAWPLVSDESHLTVIGSKALVKRIRKELLH